MQIDRCHFKFGPVGVRVTVNIWIKVSVERLGSTLSLTLTLALPLTLTLPGLEVKQSLIPGAGQGLFATPNTNPNPDPDPHPTSVKASFGNRTR